jgi:alpha-tubulin suppressor-like RCC1 family protein
VQCWGSNGKGELGNNSTSDSLVPVQVQGLTAGVTALTAKYYYSCALVSGKALCWGYNDKGQLGNNSTIDSPIPVQVQFP